MNPALDRAATDDLADGRAAYLAELARSARPRRRLTVSEWADAHRVLSPKGASEPGPWRTSRTPYLREIMDCLSARSPVRRVVFMKSAQVGATECGLNWIGYVLHHAPAPMLVVLPTLEVRKRWVRQRLDPMLAETPVLTEIVDARRRRDGANAEDIKDFPGGMLVLGGANSPASLASMPIKYVLCDEVDRFPWEIGQEGDPLGLIDERTKTFPRRKVMLVSTPTVADASRIEEEYARTDRRRYHVPCPHCGEWLVLRWSQLRWDRALTRAVYVCEHCGSEIEERCKPDMLARGRWVPEDPSRPSDVRGYHINGLYAPLGLGHGWLDLAREFVHVHDDKAKLKRFVNTALGETWKDRSRDVTARDVAARAEDWPARVAPPGCILLTLGVDVQDDRLALLLTGWGRGEACFVLDWLELPGDPARPELWSRLSEYLHTPVTSAWGRPLRIAAAAIDSGGHHTHDVYAFVRQQGDRRVMAVKGASTRGKPVLAPRPTAQDVNWRGRTIPKGVKLWTVGADTAKAVLYNRLAGDADQAPEDRLVRFCADLGADFYRQLTAEIYDPEKNRWVLRRGRRNEALDCWVYAYAAAQHPEVRVHRLRERDWARMERALQAEPDAPPEARTDVPAPAAGGKRRRRPRRRGGLAPDDWSL